MNVLTTLMKADGGTVRVAGHDVATETKAVRAVIGVTGQFAAVDDLLTGQENLQLMADLHHLRAGELDEVERHQLMTASSELSELPLFIDDQPGRSISQIGALSREVPSSVR